VSLSCRFSDEDEDDEESEDKPGERGEEIKPKENTLRRNFQVGDEVKTDSICV
jgi:hypothetical protein